MTIRSLDAETVGRALGGRRSGRQWLCRCPAHDDANPSLLVFDGHSAVQVRCLAGCDPIDVLRAINARLPELAGLSRSSGDGPQPPPSKEDDNREAEWHAALALRIWDDAVDAAGTMAESYLWSRDLSLPVDASALRFHPRCPRGKERWPALIAAMCKLDSHKPVAIQRIYLKPDGTKVGAMMLGPVAGAAMKISGHYQTFTHSLMFCPRLHVCEGLETGLALHQRGYVPTWALGSAGAIERMPVMFGIGELIICADNDPVGMSAAKTCAERWNATTHQRAIISAPREEGLDHADIVVVSA